MKFFFFKIIFSMKIFYFDAKLTYFEKNKKIKIFYVMIFFQKIAISIFLKISTTPRGMNGINGLWGP